MKSAAIISVFDKKNDIVNTVVEREQKGNDIATANMIMHTMMVLTLSPTRTKQHHTGNEKEHDNQQKKTKLLVTIQVLVQARADNNRMHKTMETDRPLPEGRGRAKPNTKPKQNKSMMQNDYKRQRQMNATYLFIRLVRDLQVNDFANLLKCGTCVPK